MDLKLSFVIFAANPAPDDLTSLPKTDRDREERRDNGSVINLKRNVVFIRLMKEFLLFSFI